MQNDVFLHGLLQHNFLHAKLTQLQDVLARYVDSTDIRHPSQHLTGEGAMERELATRRRTILSQLIPRLKTLLFEDDKHPVIRRLVRDFCPLEIGTDLFRSLNLLSNYARGTSKAGEYSWRQRSSMFTCREAFSTSLTYCRLLFGDLSNHLDDYVLRFFLSDILRHLLANNYELHEIWNQSSEDVMDFPSTEELDSNTVSKIIHSMSALDARKAFREER